MYLSEMLILGIATQWWGAIGLPLYRVGYRYTTEYVDQTVTESVARNDHEVLPESVVSTYYTLWYYLGPSTDIVPHNYLIFVLKNNVIGSEIITMVVRL